MEAKWRPFAKRDAGGTCQLRWAMRLVTLGGVDMCNRMWKEFGSGKGETEKKRLGKVKQHPQRTWGLREVIVRPWKDDGNDRGRSGKRLQISPRGDGKWMDTWFTGW